MVSDTPMAAQEVSSRAGTGTRSTLATGSSCSVWQTSKRPSVEQGSVGWVRLRLA